MISVIIITKNEEKNIERTIKSLSDKRFTEIILVDSNSSDRTIELAANINDIRLKTIVYKNPPFTASRGRYEGAMLMNRSNPYILFLDGDMEYCETFTDIALSALENNNALAGIMGQMDEQYYSHNNIIGYKENCYSLKVLVVGGALFVKTNDYFETPGYNPELIADEEGMLYSYFKKNRKKFERVSNKMFIHHTELNMSKEKLLVRIRDKKLGSFGISFFYALKDINVLIDFILRNQKFVMISLAWLTIPFAIFFNYIILYHLVVLLLIRKFKLLINYSIYFFVGLFVFVRICIQSFSKKILIK